MKKWKVAVGALVVVLFAARYAFRPEGLFIDRPVEEGMLAAKNGASLQAVASEVFHGVAHPTNGTAAIYQAGDGRRVLHFTNFRTTNGPNVHVHMVAADDAKDNASVHRDVASAGEAGNVTRPNLHRSDAVEAFNNAGEFS